MFTDLTPEDVDATIPCAFHQITSKIIISLLLILVQKSVGAAGILVKDAATADKD